MTEFLKHIARKDATKVNMNKLWYVENGIDDRSAEDHLKNLKTRRDS